MEPMIAAGKAVPRLQLEHGLAVDRVYTIRCQYYFLVDDR